MKWSEVEMGQLCLATEQVDPGNKPNTFFEYIDISSVNRDLKIISGTQSILGSEAPSRARKMVRKGDVLVSTVRPNLNAVAVVPDCLDQQIASTGFCVLRPNPERVVGKYLFYRALTPDFIGFLTARMRGANYPAVTDAVVRQAPIPWPPVSEQHRIVEILDQADAIRKKRDEADTKADRILPALFYKMFGDPIRNPLRWNVVPFEKFGDCRLGKMLDAKQQTGLNAKPYLRNVNVRWGRIDITDILQMDIDPEEQETLRLQRGDVLICEGGEVGRAAVWYNQLPECYFQKALHRLRPYSDQATPEFIQSLMWILSKRGGLHDATSQLTIAHLTGIKLKALRVIQPPIPLQEEFSARVLALRRYQDLSESRNTSVDTLFESLLHSAFSCDLTAKWREAHQVELLAEMEQQSRMLAQSGVTN